MSLLLVLPAVAVPLVAVALLAAAHRVAEAARDLGAEVGAAHRIGPEVEALGVEVRSLTRPRSRVPRDHQ